MEKQEFVELEKKVFAAFVEHLKSKNRSFELRSSFIDGQEHKSLYMSDTDTTVNTNDKDEEFVFTSGRASLQARISVGFYIQDQIIDDVDFIDEAKGLFVAFCRSASIICDAKSELLMIEANVNGYPF